RRRPAPDPGTGLWNTRAGCGCQTRIVYCPARARRRKRPEPRRAPPPAARGPHQETVMRMLPRPRGRFLALLAVLAATLMPTPASATWSVIAVDTRSGLVVIAS